jgi:hypothetical protein
MYSKTPKKSNKIVDSKQKQGERRLYKTASFDWADFANPAFQLQIKCKEFG